MKISQPDLKALTSFLNLELVSHLYSGPNSNVYLLSDFTSKYILKIYNRMNKDSYLRIEREVNALKLFGMNSITNIPKLILFDLNKFYILTTFITGSKVNIFSELYIDQIIDFGFRMKRSNLITNNLNIVNASDNYLQMNMFFDNVNNKINIIKQNLSERHLYNFFYRQLFERIQSDFNDHIKIYINCSNFTDFLANDYQIFSQSDVGLHNCLEESGRLFYIDFEHSGWDDPAKLIADWILRPYSYMKPEQISNFIHLFSDKLSDQRLIYRLKSILTLINIKWILIRLNIALSGKVEITSDFLNHEINNNIYLLGKKKISLILDNLCTS